MKTQLQSRVADVTEISCSVLFVSQCISYFASYHQNCEMRVLKEIATEDMSKTTTYISKHCASPVGRS